MKACASARDEIVAKNDYTEMLEKVLRQACSYIKGLNERAVFPADDAVEALAVFDEPMPEDPADATAVLDLLHEKGAPATVAQTGGRYFGFVTGGALPVAVAARWLSDVWDQNGALYVMSPVISALESVCEKWLVDLLRLPDGTAAGFVSGTSVANLCGLAAARDALLARMDWDVKKQGLFGAPAVKIVLGEQAHASVFKALSILGFGKDGIETVPVDGQGRMAVEKLPGLDRHTIVVAQAGNVNSGAFDPLDAICDRARAAGAWVHVDGAFGLWAAASGRTRPLVQGVQAADSWAADAHKTLNAPYDCGIVFCRSRDALARAMQAGGVYLPTGEKRDGMMYAPEMSRSARVVPLWALLKFLGRSGVARLVEDLCDRAVYFAAQLRRQGFSILNDVFFNQVLVACDAPALTVATLENIQRSGECWCGGTTWHGEPAIRVSVCCRETTEPDIDRSVKAFVQARERAAGREPGRAGRREEEKQT